MIISLEQDQYRRTYLAIVNEPALRPDDDKSLEPLQAHVISMDVSGFYVRYRDPRDGTWSDKWEEQQFPPSAVEYTVVFGERDGRFPPVVVTRAVDIPVAAFASRPGWRFPGQAGGGNTTNQVQRRDVDSWHDGQRRSASSDAMSQTHSTDWSPRRIGTVSPSSSSCG